MNTIPSDARRRILSESLIVLGEIGGNDYNYWFSSNRPREQAAQFIPDITATIGSSIQVPTPSIYSFMKVQYKSILISFQRNTHSLVLVRSKKL
jgi:hypothetical protein